mgnify:CR=1 FL=1
MSTARSLRVKCSSWDQVESFYLRKLRRGHWSVRGELDLHGLNSDEARDVLADFLVAARQHGDRCVRVIHGKGLTSPNREPVLKGKVRRWLAHWDDVLAYCEAPRCRRQALLAHFGEDSEPCNNCDTCLDPPERFDEPRVLRREQVGIVDDVLAVAPGGLGKGFADAAVGVGFVDALNFRENFFGLGADATNAFDHFVQYFRI